MPIRPTTHRAGLPAALAALALLAAPSPAPATVRSWINALGGTAGNGSNWNPAQQPSAADTLLFDLANTYAVTFGVNVPATARIKVEDGDVSFDFNVPHDHSGALLVGNVAATAELSLTSGDLTIGGPVQVGYEPASVGTLAITGAQTNVTQTSSPSSFYVGANGGTGTFNVTGGGTYSTLAAPRIGVANGTGTLLVSGWGNPLALERSSLTVEPNTSPVRIGDSGTGTASVRLGALLDIRRDLEIGWQPGTSGTLIVGGSSAADSSRVMVDGHLWIAHNQDANPGGTGLVSLEARGVMDVTGSTYTYDSQAGGSGTLELAEGSRFSTASLHVSDPATELMLDGGVLQVIGGGLDLNGAPLTVSSTTGTPTIELHGSSFTTIGPSTYPLKLGHDGYGRLRVLNQANLTVTGLQVNLGNLASGHGVLEVARATATIGSQLAVGFAGHGDMIVRDDATVTVGELYVAANNNSGGSVIVEDLGTDLSVSGRLWIGGSAAPSSSSDGDVIVRDGAHLRLNAIGFAGAVHANGTLELSDGGVLDLVDPFYVYGQMTLAGGSTSGGNVTMNPHGVLSGAGDVNSKVSSVTDTTSLIEATGTLSLGRADAADGFATSGALAVGGAHVTLRDADSALVGIASLAGGTLDLPPGGGVVQAGKRLSGNGTITGALRNRGEIQAGLAPGLTFAGTLTSYDRPIAGTLRFLDGGAFVGRGALLGSVQLDAGATLTNTGPLTIGAAPLASVVTVDGVFDAGAPSVYFSATDTVRVGGSLVVNLTNVNGNHTLLIRAGGSLTGDGEEFMPTVVAGTLAPGGVAGPFGDFEMASTLRLLPGARVAVEVGNVSLGEYDLIRGVTTATLGGTLDVTLAGLVVSPGDSVQILDAASVTGAFAGVTQNGGPPDGTFAVHVHSNGVWLVFPGTLVDVPELPGRGGDPTAIAFAALGSPGPAPALALELPAPSHVLAEVFDLGGRRIATVFDGALPVGRHRLSRGLEALPSGALCFARARITSATGVETRRTRLIRAR